MSHKELSPQEFVSSTPPNHLHPYELQFMKKLSNDENIQQQRAHLVLNNFISTSSSAEKSSLSGFNHNYKNHHQFHDEGISEGNENETQNSHSNFLYIYFLFSYYLCLTPFRLKKVKPSAHQGTFVFEIYEFLPQKILCAIANFLALTRYAVEFRRCVEDVTKENPISFFKLFEACSSLVFKTVILRCFWKNKAKFLHIVRFLESPFILPYNKFKMQSIFTISTLCGFYVIIGFARMITGSGFLRPSSLSMSWWARRLVAEGRYSFFLSNDSHFDSAPLHSEISSFDTFLAVITGFTFQCRFIAGYFVDVGILLCVLSLWAPVAGFSTSIRKRFKKRLQQSSCCGEGGSLTENEVLNKMSPSRQLEYVHSEIRRQDVVMEQYKALKRLTELISEANGPTILPFISEAIFGYAIFFEDVLITQDFSHRLILMCFYFCAVNILMFSADVCRKMQCMKTWLWDEDRFSSFPHQKLMLILHDLSTNSVGITASGIFTIDFYLVGSMISVLITLFIIRLQYQTLDVM